MLHCQRQNFHHSVLPKPGEIGRIDMRRGRQRDWDLDDGLCRRKCIVSHYALTDSADYRFSIGIHTVWVRFLDNGEVRRFSGFWFVGECGNV